MTLHACDVFFSASSSSLQQRLPHSFYTLEVSAYSHTHTQTICTHTSIHILLLATFSIPPFRSLILFFSLSLVTSSHQFSHSLPLCLFFLNVFLFPIILCTLCAALYLNSNYHNATMQFFLRVSCVVCVCKPIKAQHNTIQHNQLLFR